MHKEKEITGIAVGGMKRPPSTFTSSVSLTTKPPGSLMPPGALSRRFLLERIYTIRPTQNRTKYTMYIKHNGSLYLRKENGITAMVEG